MTPGSKVQVPLRGQEFITKAHPKPRISVTVENAADGI